MEKINKYFIYGGLIIILSMISIVTYIKVHNIHMEKTYNVFNKQLQEAALNCYRDGLCEEEISISDLEGKEYIDNALDPKTKKHLGNTTITISENKAKINY